MNVTVVIPSIPPRTKLLTRALASVANQTVPAVAVSIAYDHQHQGAGPTRTSALNAVQTEWTAFLDDDDELLPRHLETLIGHQRATGADLVWSWYRVAGGRDPHPQHRGRQWDPKRPHNIPVTTLVRTELARRCVFPAALGSRYSGDDMRFHIQLSELGAKFAHVPEITWVWHHDSKNTSGLPSRW